MMQTYVAEIDGRAVMAFRAKNGLKAQNWLDTAQTVRAELMVLQSEGKPLWDGRMEIIARAATLAEKAAYRRKSVEMSFADEGHNPDDALALLVPVKEATTMTRTS
jgi:hypothetical protein